MVVLGIPARHQHMKEPAGSKEKDGRPAGQSMEPDSPTRVLAHPIRPTGQSMQPDSPARMLAY